MKSILFILCSILIISSCNSEALVDNRNSNESISKDAFSNSISRYNLATILSESLTDDVELTTLLKGECFKRFDGDDNILAAELFQPSAITKSSSFFSKFIDKTSLKTKSQRLNITSFIDSLINNDPLLHIYYYEGTIDMDLSNIKFMVLADNGNDEEQDMLIIDSKGNVSTHSPFYEPEESMFVLATNERTEIIESTTKNDDVYLYARNKAYKLKESALTHSADLDVSKDNNIITKSSYERKRGADYANRDAIFAMRFKSYKRVRDCEPASKGQPEINIIFNYLEKDHLKPNYDSENNITNKVSEGSGSKTHKVRLRGHTWCKKRGDKIYTVYIKEYFPFIIAEKDLGSQFTVELMEEDNGKEKERTIAITATAIDKVNSVTKDPYTKAGIFVLALIGKITGGDFDDYLGYYKESTTDDNVIINNSLVGDHNANRSVGDYMYMWISQKIY